MYPDITPFLRVDLRQLGNYLEGFDEDDKDFFTLTPGQTKTGVMLGEGTFDGAEDEELPGVQNLLTSICIGEPA